MDIVKKHLTNGQYLTDMHEKKSLFLHHTVSTTAMSAWRWWNSTKDRVGTAYIVDRDGVIYECFDPRMWAFHMGVKGDDNWHEKHSINIEIVAAGPIRLVEDQYRFYPLWPGNKTRWTTIPEEEVYKFNKEWHRHKLWHKYTEDQIDALEWLIGKLALDFPALGIENDMDKIFEFDQSVIDNHTPGIWTHNTVRDDKSDPFPQPELITMLKKLQSELTGVKKAYMIPEVKKVANKPSPTKPKAGTKSKS